MPGLKRLAAVLLCILVFPALLVGCDRVTCEGACAQYYGDGEDQCNKPSINTNTQTSQIEAERNCVDACQDALYTTSSSDGGVNQLSNETDALDFIHCVIDKDYVGAPNENPGATTCDNLRFDCDRIRW